MKQISKFFILGIISTLLDLLVYFLLINIGFHYIIAIICGYLSGFVINVYIGRKYIFQDGRKVDSFQKELNILIIINILALGLNILIVFFLFEYFAIFDEYFARLIAIVFVFFWNYFTRKIFVYY